MANLTDKLPDQVIVALEFQKISAAYDSSEYNYLEWMVALGYASRGDVVDATYVPWLAKEAARAGIDNLVALVHRIVEAWASHVVDNSMRRTAMLEMAGDEIDARRSTKP